MKDRCLSKQPTQNAVVFTSAVEQTKIVYSTIRIYEKKAPKISFHTWSPQRVIESLTDITVKSQVNTIFFPKQDS